MAHNIFRFWMNALFYFGFDYDRTEKNDFHDFYIIHLNLVCYFALFLHRILVGSMRSPRTYMARMSENNEWANAKVNADHTHSHTCLNFPRVCPPARSLSLGIRVFVVMSSSSILIVLFYHQDISRLLIIFIIFSSLFSIRSFVIFNSFFFVVFLDKWMYGIHDICTIVGVIVCLF